LDGPFSLGGFWLGSEKTMSKPCEYLHIEVVWHIFVSRPDTHAPLQRAAP
jgi:hypothetical protein